MYAKRPLVTLCGRCIDMAIEQLYHLDSSLQGIWRTHPWRPAMCPLQKRTKVYDKQCKQSRHSGCIPLYESLGFVRHMTKWHSISSGNTNLLHTGHLIPVRKERIQHRWPGKRYICVYKYHWRTKCAMEAMLLYKRGQCHSLMLPMQPMQCSQRCLRQSSTYPARQWANENGRLRREEGAGRILSQVQLTRIESPNARRCCI